MTERFGGRERGAVIRNGRRERKGVCNRGYRIHSIMAHHEASSTWLLC